MKIKTKKEIEKILKTAQISSEEELTDGIHLF